VLKICKSITKPLCVKRLLGTLLAVFALVFASWGAGRVVG